MYYLMFKNLLLINNSIKRRVLRNLQSTLMKGLKIMEKKAQRNIKNSLNT
jgi:hypothetical protein